ncbi:MAG: hypothetical protein HYX52_02010 [Chloroflexi bacterium]|nr:hypothetical protein [Chloroflexota bacterium]
MQRPRRWSDPFHLPKALHLGKPARSGATPAAATPEARKRSARPAKPPVPDDTGLYGVLGIRPDAPDWEIPVAYRRRAADLASRRVSNRETLRELNAAYEALRYPDLRMEYDQQRAAALQPSGQVAHPSTVRRPSAYPRFRHPRATRSTRAATYGALLGVIAVMAVAVVAGTFFLERVAGGIAPLTSLARLTGLSTASRPATSGATPGATVASTSGAPTIPDDLKGSQVSVSNSQPQRGSDIAVLAKLVRNGQPLANTDVYAEAQFRTATTRIPASGTVRTDSSGTASLPIAVGDATAGYEVRVTLHAQVDGRDVEWPVGFTPR